MVWTLATYFLEGRALTFLRPETAGARLAYALVANIIVGVMGAGLILRAAVRQAGLDIQRLALRTPGRTAISVALGFGLGFAAFAFRQPVTLAPRRYRECVRAGVGRVCGGGACLLGRAGKGRRDVLVPPRCRYASNALPARKSAARGIGRTIKPAPSIAWSRTSILLNPTDTSA